MVARQDRGPLLLQRVPDARQAPWPLLPAVLLPYVALMLGGAVASLAAVYNSVALRRVKPALLSLVVGIVGWVGFGAVVLLAFSGGLRNPALAILPARVFSIGLGVLLAWSQWSHVRGHEYLGGRTVAVMHGVIVAFIAVLIIPFKPLLVLQGLWVLLLH